mmetsp:Transcript_8073/g.13940  ORF Transcript_8073/g.13940 Transcript_8073/m.13940 type:complete len:261 (-) Transcript_8073:78-860(-)
MSCTLGQCVFVSMFSSTSSFTQPSNDLKRSRIEWFVHVRLCAESAANTIDAWRFLDEQHNAAKRLTVAQRRLEIQLELTCAHGGKDLKHCSHTKFRSLRSFCRNNSQFSDISFCSVGKRTNAVDFTANPNRIGISHFNQVNKRFNAGNQTQQLAHFCLGALRQIAAQLCAISFESVEDLIEQDVDGVVEERHARRTERAGRANRRHFSGFLLARFERADFKHFHVQFNLCPRNINNFIDFLNNFRSVVVNRRNLQSKCQI